MQYFDRHEGGEKTILVSMHVATAGNTSAHLSKPSSADLLNNDLPEFRLLAASAGADVIGELTGNLNKISAKFFLGAGKTEELAALVQEQNADLVLFNHPLSPSQERNLEKALQCRVIDRTGLILAIFAQRARSYEGKLQVELAQLSHLSTRLVRGWTHLERQKGGIGLRGPGETQLETDRRLLQIRVHQLTQKLGKVKQTRQIGRSRRQKSATPMLSLVGYTNAGKSTLFNRLTGENSFAADQLFATLDPTLRSIDWPTLGKVVLADTVGFVKNLPHELIESFHATLEETLQADLLLHVIDSSSDSVFNEIRAVNQVLQDIKACAPMLLVYNKIDQNDQSARLYTDANGMPTRVDISAKTGAGIDELMQAVSMLLGGLMHRFDLTLPVGQGALLHALHQLEIITHKDYDDTGQALLSVQTTAIKLRQLLGEYGLAATDVLPQAQACLIMPTENAF